MHPEILRAGFRIAFVILVASLAILPFEPAGSAEQVVTVLALLVGAAFAIGVALIARMSNPRPPDDSGPRNGYNHRSMEKGR